jgi:hypothetical protein
MKESSKILSWDEFNSNQMIHTNPIVTLKNSDFINGTLRILQKCTLFLTENIIFNPIGSDGLNYYYDPEKSMNRDLYKYTGYRLGFFAAITIECDNVIIDLNGYEFKQSKRHYMIQRFYSHIELANQPFIPNQGPGNFGNNFVSSTHCIIKNGYFGLSAHHCIHGNNNKNITIYNVVFKDYEVAGIGLNGIENLRIQKCKFNGNYKHVSTNGLFSASLFLRKFVIKAIEYASLDESKNDLQSKLLKLENMINTVLNLTISGNESEPHNKLVNTDENIKFIINPSGLPDGSATYGILINGHGVAVNGFSSQIATEKDYKSNNIKFKDIEIMNHEGDVTETVALSDESPLTKIQVDTAGSVLPITKLINICDGSYKGTILSDLQIALARWSSPFLDTNDPKLVELRKNGYFGTLNIHHAIVAWASEGITYNHKGFEINNKVTFVQVKKALGFNLIHNGDTMFHVNKGIIGIRIDSVANIYFNNVTINQVKNIGDTGSGNYSDNTDGGHYSQNNMIGYCGCDSYGIKFSGCYGIYFYKIIINNIISYNGTSCGIHINDTNEIHEGSIMIENIKTNGKNLGTTPNKLPVAYGYCLLNITSQKKICDCSSITIKNIFNKYIPYNVFNYAKTMIDHNNDKIVISNNSGY